MELRTVGVENELYPHSVAYQRGPRKSCACVKICTLLCAGFQSFIIRWNGELIAIAKELTAAIINRQPEDSTYDDLVRELSLI
jgi:hypothetical protein